MNNNSVEEIMEKMNTYKTNSRAIMAKMECKLYIGNLPPNITERQVGSPAPGRRQQRPRQPEDQQ